MRRFASLAILAASLAPATAGAYDTGSLAGGECHEKLTRRAIAEAQLALGLEAPPFPDYVEGNALVADLPFETNPYDGFDIVATVLANREVDLNGLENGDLDRLAQIHGADENQPEHCLRRSNRDDPDGSLGALQDCRAYIEQQMGLVFDGLGRDGRPNLEMRVLLKTVLAVRGSVDIVLPQFHVALGRALHALQDNFSHSYRSQDDTKVTAVLNYVDLAEDRLDPAIDGPGHSMHLDDCADMDELRQRRWVLANDASTDLVKIAFDRALDRSAKEQALRELLDANMAYEPGCTLENGWCGAPEAEFTDPEPCTCTHTDTSDTSWLWLLAVPAILILRKRRWLGVFVGAWLLATPQTARADGFGLYVSGSGAIMKTALATSVGARYGISNNWVLGIDAEWNPWIGGSLDKFRSGSINAYATIIFRIPMRHETLNLRSTLQLGASRIMFDLVGVAEGSIGPYVGASLLGVEWAFDENFYLVIDPAHISIPMPQITGVPFLFPQYRVTIGIQWGG